MDDPAVLDTIVCRQTQVGQHHLAYEGNNRRNPNPVHAAKVIHPRWAADDSDFTSAHTMCGVGAHSYAYDRDGNPVRKWDPNHPQACPRCVRIIRDAPGRELECERPVKGVPPDCGDPTCFRTHP